MSRPDALAVIDAIYRIDSDDDAWLSGVMEAARPALDDGLGVAAYSFRMHATGMTALKLVQTENSRFAEIVLPGSRADPDLALKVHRAPVTTLSEVAGRRVLAASPMIREEFAPYGVHDVMGVLGVEPDGWGVGLAIPLRSARRPTPVARAFWQRVAGHWQAAHRLRRRLAVSTWADLPIVGSMHTRDGQQLSWSTSYERQSSRGAAAPSQAVLDPSGRVLDASDEAREAPAREALRRAAIAIDRTRALMLRGTSDADALSAWRALVDGRWSLVETFESDGRRFLLARKNTPGATPTPLLEESERVVLGYRAAGHSLKLIAYEMGLSIGWASRTLKSAVDKLGVRSPAELVAIMAAQPPPGKDRVE